MARLLMERRTDPAGQVHARIWVEATVTRLDLARGINARVPGRHRFTGLWYGTRADAHGSYGKVLPVGGAMPVGKVGRQAAAYMARKLGAPPRFPMRSGRRFPAPA